MYDDAVLDEDDYDEMDPEARREAERLMRKRDREDAAARGRLHRGLLYGANNLRFLSVNYDLSVERMENG